jgi:predicted DNA-binding antitoxin AbrB/MazE fold protein
MTSEQAATSSNEQIEATIEAVLENGVLRPLQQHKLAPGSVVRVRIVERTDRPRGRDRFRQITDWFARRAAGLRGGERLALGLAGLIMAGVAQYNFLDQLAFSWMAFGFAILGILLFAFALSGLALPWAEPQPRPAHTPAAGGQPTARRQLIGWLLAGSAALVTLLLLYLLQLSPPLDGYSWALPFWVAAIAAAVAGCRLLAGSGLVEMEPPARRIWPLLLALLLLALGLRVWQVGSLPPTLSGDEGSQGLEAVKVLKGEIRNPFSTGWLGVPTMSFYFNAVSIALLGNTATGLRLPWVFIGTATVLVSYLLVRRLHGPFPGLLTAALLATYHYHIHYSRLGSNQVADALFVALALLFLYRGYDRRSALDWALCGAVAGIAQYFYAGARLTVVIVVAVTALLALRDGRRFWREQRGGLAALLFVALLSAAPMMQYALRFPDAYNARVNEVGIFQSGWLEREQEILNSGALPILLDQLKRSALAFNAYPDRTSWYGSPQPLFGLIDGTLFILGLGYAAMRLLDRRLFPMVAWWGGAMMLGGVLTESPPSSQRLITMAVPACFFAALAITGLVALLRKAWALRPAVGLAMGLTLLIGSISIRWYFVEYTPLLVYGNRNAVVATELAHYAREHVDVDDAIYFFGAPRMYYDFGTVPYLAPEARGYDIYEPLQIPFDRQQAQASDEVIFVFLPERLAELSFVQATFPDGNYREIMLPTGNEILFAIYRVRL